jgi:hypothetical protein
MGNVTVRLERSGVGAIDLIGKQVTFTDIDFDGFAPAAAHVAIKVRRVRNCYRCQSSSEPRESRAYDPREAGQ